MSDLWASVLKRVTGRIGPKSFRDWFEPTRLASCGPDALEVHVPNVLHAAWMEQN